MRPTDRTYPHHNESMKSIVTCDTSDDVKIKGLQSVPDKGGESVVRWHSVVLDQHYYLRTICCDSNLYLC